MTMPTIEDLERVYNAATIAFSIKQNPHRAGILAVLDAMRPVVAEACIVGMGCAAQTHAVNPGIAKRHAARIIAQIKGESRE